jgi:hypothetical protein
VTTPALAYGKLPKRRRSLSPTQRRMLERGLCCCPSCVAARPERAALLAARASPALCVGCGRAHAECDGSALGCWRAKERLDTPGEGA